MADTKTSAELSASTLTGSELLRVVQGGVDRKTTLNAIVADLGLPKIFTPKYTDRFITISRH